MKKTTAMPAVKGGHAGCLNCGVALARLAWIAAVWLDIDNRPRALLREKEER